MYQILSFVKGQRRVIVFYLWLIGGMAVIGYLYRLPIEPLLYLAFLGTSGLAVYLGGSYVDWRRRYRAALLIGQRQGMDKHRLIQTSISKDDLIEKLYQQLIDDLVEQGRQQRHINQMAIMDMVDYYTLWVHQIKMPIATAKLLCQTKSDTGFDIEVELFKIERYVEMALTYLRLTTGDNDLVVATHSLDRLLTKSLQKYAKSFILKQIRLDYQPIRYQLVTDAKWFSLAVEQLLANALKYTPVGGQIMIYLRRTEDGRTTPVWLAIEDSGPGIDQRDLPRVFDKGYTGYTGHQQKASTGLGLYLCRHILTKLSLAVKLESEKGKGTKALIGLPAEEEEN